MFSKPQKRNAEKAESKVRKRNVSAGGAETPPIHHVTQKLKRDLFGGPSSWQIDGRLPKRMGTWLSGPIPLLRLM